jgi:sortase family protein
VRADNASANRVPEHRWLTRPVEVDGTPAGETAGVPRESDAHLESIGGVAIGAAGTAVPKKGFVRRLGLPVCVGLAAAFVAGTGYLAVTDPQTARDLGRWGATASPRATDFGVESGGAADPFGPAAAVLSGAPTRLRIGAIGVDTPLESLHLARGALTPPKNFARAGWYADGTAPGDLGPAVMAGHVDSKRGPAVFYRLRELQVGDQIEVVRGGKPVRFTVVSTAWYPKTQFPTEEVYGPTPDRQLRLITCGGVFDHRLRSYKDNLVVYAVAG